MLKHWSYGVFGFLGLGGIVYYAYLSERAFRQDLTKYVSTLSHRVKRAGSEVINELPIGILLYDEEKNIEWHNPYMLEITKAKETIIGKSLLDVIPQLEQLNKETATLDIQYEERFYKVQVESDERLLYFTDITDYHILKRNYQAEKVAFGIVHLDNLEEISQVMDDQSRSKMMTSVTESISDWALEYGIYLRRVSSDKFFIVIDEMTLKQMEQGRFEILDVVRQMTVDNKIPITLSIGIGSGVQSFIELGQLAQSSLDIALGRGGDQAAVKSGTRLNFYGGKSNAVEKRTRVRARVISHALRNLIQESEHVFIVGHKNADMDSIGAAVGVLKAVQLNKRKGYIVLDQSNPSIDRLMEEIKEHGTLFQHFITPERAVQLCDNRSLLVVVDTHKPSLVMEPKLLHSSNRVVVIDHHRRSEEFIHEPVLVYMEPYASSTCELVTELLQYQSDKIVMDSIEATALLAGIVVDTKSFALRTGSRTFEAASFLRRVGADTALIQGLLKEDIDQFNRRAEIIRNTEVVYDRIAIAVGVEDQRYGQLLIAQTADTLLNMSGVQASFVVSYIGDGYVAISARSLGQINVQVIMEQLGGGGHLTNAATQLEGVTQEEAIKRLKEVLDDQIQKGGVTT